eukprot:snap_masked-scaffold_27-processed-gene-0.22-mRNA-1 protein AED:0.25 eAED:0.26 QI:0/0/0/0.8/1/1/5/0/945
MKEDPHDVDLSIGTHSIPLSTLTIFFFIGLTLSTYLFSKVFISSANSASSNSDTSKDKKIKFLTLESSDINNFLSELSQLCLILLYIWISENRPAFSHGEKWHDLDLFWFLTLGFFIAGLFSLKIEPENSKAIDVLNRNQTEEWKGWMQVMFLLYHYFHVNEVYNSIRIMISCYVWMTGFGNFSFFYLKQDYSFVRFYQMLWRLNFLVVFLCLLMNNLYILYYICPLHTFYFLLTFGTMKISSNINYTKYKMRFKIFFLAALIFLIWEFPDIYNIVFFYLPTEFHPGYALGQFGVKYEWQFRSGLDHYSTIFGMIFALNFPITKMFLEKSRPLTRVLVGLALAFCVWIYTRYFFWLPKLEYNEIHPYIFLLPLLSYVFFRNISHKVRRFRIRLFEEMGKVTLETYLMQHHIWLTSNAKSLLVLVPGYPKLNLLVVTFFYLLVSRRLYRLTINLRARLIPEDYTGALISFFGIVSFFSVLGGLAFLFQALRFPWIILVLFCTLGGGFISWIISQVTKQTWIAGIKYGNSSQPVKKFIFRLFLFTSIGLLSFLYVIGSKASVYTESYGIGPIRPYNREPFSERGLLNMNQVSRIVDLEFKPVDHSRQLELEENIAFEFRKSADGFSIQTAKELSVLFSSSSIVIFGDTDFYYFLRDLVEILGLSLTEQNQFDSPGNVTNEYKVYRSKIIETRFMNIYDNRKEFNFAFFLVDDDEQVQLCLDALAEGNFIPDLLVYQVRSYDEQSLQAILSMNKHINTLIFSDDSDLDSSKFYSEYFTNVGFIELFRLKTEYEELLKIGKVAGATKKEEDAELSRVLVQIISNVFQVFKDISTESRSLSSEKKGSGGGVAHNPKVGLLILAVIFIKLFFFDNFYGLFKLVSNILQDPAKSLTWEDSVDRLHESIFRNKNDVVEKLNVPSFKEHSSPVGNGKHKIGISDEEVERLLEKM